MELGDGPRRGVHNDFGSGEQGCYKHGGLVCVGEDVCDIVRRNEGARRREVENIELQLLGRGGIVRSPSRSLRYEP